MKISVITVTYNNLPGLRRTLPSVVGQDYSDFEYIVVDGASQDGTVAYLKEHLSGITTWVSEPDSGIYEAMNKGVRLSTGDYCIFMNAGDLFVSPRVLSQVHKHLNDADIILGNEIVVNENDTIRGFTASRHAYTLKHLLTSSTSHQATFIRRGLLLEYPYDESLRLVSDWKFILERFLEGCHTFKEINVDVCFFRTGGATYRYQTLGLQEKKSVLEQYPEYKEIWSKPYSPHLSAMIISKTREILAHIRYGR